VKKEVSVTFLTGPLDRISTLMHAGVMVYGWVGGKHACVDLSGVSPHVRLGVKPFTIGQTVVSSKVTKHEKACSDNQHVLIPFAFALSVS